MGTRKFLVAACVAGMTMAWGAVAAPIIPLSTPRTQEQAPPGLVLQRCQISWADHRIISSKIPGRLRDRLVEDGDQVEAGQVLARLDDREARAEYEFQKIVSDSDLDILAQIEKYKEYLARESSANRLFPEHAISEEEFRLARVNVAVNQILTDKEVEKKQIEQKKTERSLLFLQEHEIRSPIRGRIRKCFKRPDEQIAANDPQLFHIVATDKVWIEGWAPASEVFRVRVGQPVDVRLAISDWIYPMQNMQRLDEPKPSISPGLPASRESEPAERPRRAEIPFEKTVFKGRIIYIDPDVDYSAKTFRVRAEVKNQYDSEGEPVLRSGLNANMSIQFGQPPEAKPEQ